MVKTIIPVGYQKSPPKGVYLHPLRISECFTDTIQGENFVGYPSTFLRLQGCILNCRWCDSVEVWKKGSLWEVSDLLKLWDKEGVIQRLKSGQHLVITGGSPLLQQDFIVELLLELLSIYRCYPRVEIENECVILPVDKFNRFKVQWNNSPKLSNSEIPKETRYKPDVIKHMSEHKSYFKFVINSEKDWNEIEDDFLKPKLIYRDQIVLMPEGQTREELQKNYPMVVEMACKHNVRMSPRLHIDIWNKTVGV